MFLLVCRLPLVFLATGYFPRRHNQLQPLVY
jgi:hypothetical protein